MFVKKCSAVILIAITASLSSCDKIGEFASPQNVSQIPIVFGPEFYVTINNESVKVSGVDLCSQDGSIQGNVCIRIEPATTFVNVKLHTTPSIIEKWSVKHEGGNRKVSLIRPNGELVTASPAVVSKHDN